MFSNIDWFDLIVSGVIVSLIVNLLSSYLYPKTESFLARFSAKRKKQKEVRQQKILEEAQRLSENPHEELIFKQLSKSFFKKLEMLKETFFSLSLSTEKVS